MNTQISSIPLKEFDNCICIYRATSIKIQNIAIAPKSYLISIIVNAVSETSVLILPDHRLVLPFLSLSILFSRFIHFVILLVYTLLLLSGTPLSEYTIVFLSFCL